MSVDGEFLNLGLVSAAGKKLAWDSSEDLRVATGEISRLDEKRLDGRRSALFAGGVVVVSGVIIGTLFKAVNRRDNVGSEIEIEPILIPLFSIRH